MIVRRLHENQTLWVRNGTEQRKICMTVMRCREQRVIANAYQVWVYDNCYVTSCVFEQLFTYETLIYIFITFELVGQIFGVGQIKLSNFLMYGSKCKFMHATCLYGWDLIQCDTGNLASQVDAFMASSRVSPPRTFVWDDCMTS